MSNPIAPARWYAALILAEIEGGAYSHLALSRWQERGGLSERDWALATELVYGVVRYKKRLEWVLEQYLGKPARKLEPGVRRALLLALYQLEFLPRIPERAVVHQAVEQARGQGSPAGARLVNGLLRNYLRQNRAVTWPDPELEPARYLGVFFSHPEWLVSRWLDRLGFASAQAVLRRNNCPRPLTGRFNTLRGSPIELARYLRGEGLGVQAGFHFPEAFRFRGPSSGPSYFRYHSFAEGFWTVQDEGAMAPAWLLRPRPGERVLDACAGPGGKTGHLAQLMHNCGEIMATDIHSHRLELVKQSRRRLGLEIVRCLLQDGREFPLSLGYFQKVLVDAPCSGTGVMGRRPDVRWRKDELDLVGLQQLQLQILRGVSRVVAPGGVLVYATCSLEPEENQATIEAFLQELPDFALENATRWLPVTLAPAVSPAGWAELWPHRTGTDGMYMARLRRLR